jgi:hypothetical protein
MYAMKIITDGKLKDLLEKAWRDGFSKCVEDETGFPSDQIDTSRYSDMTPGAITRRNKVVQELLSEASKQ